MKKVELIFLYLWFFHLSFLTKGQLKEETNEFYKVKIIPTPDGLSAETGGITFMPDGRLAACFHRGEVMTYHPEKKEWKLFASGLHDPLGIIAMSNNQLVVMQRPELTLLSDDNNDGEADYFKTITDDFGMSGNYHEFAFGPTLDKNGNFFISLCLASGFAGIRNEIRGKYDSLGREGRMYSCVPYRGWVMKVSPDGKITPWASGFRSPNGLGFDMKGNLFVPDNQGDWVGTSTLYHVKKDSFYGHPVSLIWTPGFNKHPLEISVDSLNKKRKKPSVYFPQGIMANSPTQPVCDTTGGKFGPFAGQLFLGEMNLERIVRVMMEEVDGEFQGACIPFIDNSGLRKGNNRLCFAPDGSLWVGQTDHGWLGDKGIQRISWTGKMPFEVLAMNVTSKGFDLTFTQPVDIKTVKILSNFKFKKYYYQYHHHYGSDQMDVKEIPVKRIKISKDKKRVSLILPEMVKGYIYELKMENIKSSKQIYLKNNLICYTLNKLKK